jgi:hypothetical protein
MGNYAVPSDKVMFTFYGFAVSLSLGLAGMMIAYSINMSARKDILYLCALISFYISFIFFFIFGGFILMNAIEPSRPRLSYVSNATSPLPTHFLSTTLVQPLTWFPRPPAKCPPTAPLPLRGRQT